jgi:hypothetical protein
MHAAQVGAKDASSFNSVCKSRPASCDCKVASKAAKVSEGITILISISPTVETAGQLLLATAPTKHLAVTISPFLSPRCQKQTRKQSQSTQLWNM